MADTKISALSALASVAGTEEFPVNAGGTNKKATLSQLVKAVTLTDNAIVRADGTAGQVQGSTVTISDAGTIYTTGFLNGGLSVTASASGPVSAGVYRNIYTNEGAGGSVVFNLPTAGSRYDVTFIVQAAQNMVVTAASGDTIRIAAGVSSAGGTATNGTVGGVLRLIAINATEWIGTTVQGTWSLA